MLRKIVPVNILNTFPQSLYLKQGKPLVRWYLCGHRPGNYRAIDGRKGKLTGENFAYPPYPGCFEYLLGKVPAPLFLYDVADSFSSRPEFFEQKTFKHRCLGAYTTDNQFTVLPLHIYYDYLIYMKNTTLYNTNSG